MSLRLLSCLRHLTFHPPPSNVKESDLGEMICVPYDKLFKDTNISRVVTKQVREVKSDRVVLEDGEEIAFTYAVVATGKQWVTPVE